ncbi:MAG: vanadium-dependent haloperoxidase [Gemmatimonadaceae bacterium]
MRANLLWAVVTAVTFVGCDDGSSEPTVINEGPVLSANETTASERWMLVTRGIVGRREIGSPLGTARAFALVAVAQYNASVAAGTTQSSGKRPSEAAAVSSASAAVLASLYPAEQAVIDAQVAADATYFPAFASEADASYSAGTTIGKSISAAVLARAATDRTDAVFTGTIPTGPGYWVNAAPPAQPVAPRWGEAKPWLMTSGSQFRTPTPPAFNSTTFLSALAEVKSAAVNITPDQLVVAQFWQYASGPGGPMGYFTELATASITAAHMNERQTARVYAVLHMAMMDASIGCWDSKYNYWYVRPYQADPAMPTPVGRPNFPSYPSAHSCLSSAAAGVIVGLFPSTKTEMDAKVAAAGEARIFAGLHYRFDVTAGQELGYKVAALALTRVPAPNVLIPLN